jgi:DNA primase
VYEGDVLAGLPVRYLAAMAFSREDIDRVRDRTDLVELASEVTKVKRTGRSVMAVCPFHSEKTPSLSIDAARGLYHCFGCGESGDVFRWVERTQGLGFNDAIELLARRAGVELSPDPDAAKRRDRRQELVDAVEAAIAFYHEVLKGEAGAATARAYLRGRSYDAAVVERFHIGYSPGAWDALVTHLQEKGLRDRAMIEAGLVSRSSRGGLVDRFRNRVMFPIYDLRGDGVGFGARVLDGDGPKYLNSPETPIYHKSRLLYGLNWAKSEIVRTDQAVVVEGYTDVIAFHLAGMPVAVATCGTALGEEHLDLLRRFSERVVLAFDADEAGAGAALRGFERSVPGDLDLRVAVLPEGRDPADLIASGDRVGLEKAVTDSAPLLQFRIERELERFDLSEPEARGRAVRRAAELIGLHPDAVVRHEYAVLVARRTGVDVDVVSGAVRRSGRDPQPGRQSGPPPRLTGTELAERELLRLLLANDPGIPRDSLTAELFTDAEHRRAFALIGPAVAATPPGEPPDLGTIIGSDESPAAAMLRRLAMEERPLAALSEVMTRLELSAVERRIDGLRIRLQKLDPDAEEQEYSDVFNHLIALERQRRELRSRE